MLRVVTMRRRLRSPLLHALLLLAFLVRGLIPAGFMPATQAGFGFQLQLCSAEGLAPSPLLPGFHDAADPAGAPSDAPAPHGDGTHERPCIYAASAVSAPPPAALAALLAHAPAPAPASIALPAAVRPSIVRAQSPRAPPAHA
jgi:hypothetical protein